MVLGAFLNPFLEEAGLIDKNDASDPMAAATGFADAAILADFFVSGAEVVGEMGGGIDMQAALPQPAPELAPTPGPLQAAPNTLMTPDMNMGP